MTQLQQPTDTLSMKSVTTLDQSGAEQAGVVNRSVKTISEIETWLGTPLFMVPCYPRTKKPMVKYGITDICSIIICILCRYQYLCLNITICHS